MRAEVRYDFSIVFDEPAYEHIFALRILPRSDARQTLLEAQTNLRNIWNYEDGFGNTSVVGKIKEPHSVFDVSMTAAVEIDADAKVTDYVYDCFGFESKYTSYSKIFVAYANSLTPPSNTLGRIIYLTNAIFDGFEYKKNFTDVESDIDHLLSIKAGVCQDFSHLLIALLRYYGINARYVNGYIDGDGETHAWVEAYIDGEWIGVDPTHNVLIGDMAYVKVAHGRDFADCTVNRGLFLGGSGQKMDISVYVKSGVCCQ